MRGVLQGIVGGVQLAFLDTLDLLANGDHRIAEAVALGFAIPLRRLDNQGAGHRNGPGRGMEAVIHLPHCDVVARTTRARTSSSSRNGVPVSIDIWGRRDINK